jgi:hypothetical protein
LTGKSNKQLLLNSQAQFGENRTRYKYNFNILLTENGIEEIEIISKTKKVKAIRKF